MEMTDYVPDIHKQILCQ